MNIKKSIKKALAEVEQNQKWLADQLGIGTSAVSHRINREGQNLGQIEEMAKIFNMKVSEFIALGEDK